MPALLNSKHEAFAMLVAKGQTAAKAYMEVYPGSKETACGSAPRLKLKVAGRIVELKEQIARAQIHFAIKEQDQRVNRAQRRWDMLHTAIEDRFDDPKLKQKHARINPAEFSEARQLEQHVAIQLNQWQEHAHAQVVVQAVIHLPSGAATTEKMRVLDIEPAQIED